MSLTCVYVYVSYTLDLKNFDLPSRYKVSHFFCIFLKNRHNVRFRNWEESILPNFASLHENTVNSVHIYIKVFKLKSWQWGVAQERTTYYKLDCRNCSFLEQENAGRLLDGLDFPPLHLEAEGNELWHVWKGGLLYSGRTRLSPNKCGFVACMLFYGLVYSCRTNSAFREMWTKIWFSYFIMNSLNIVINYSSPVRVNLVYFPESVCN